MISNPNRIIHIDIAKGIGMALIVISHICVSSSFAETQNFKIYDGIINSFYVPLFFILSGVFEKDSNDINKFYSRILHLIKLICIFVLFGCISSGIIHNDWNPMNFKHQSVVWFIITLLYITILWRLIRVTRLNILVITLLVIIGGGVLSHYHKSIFYIGQALICFPFYTLGFLLKQYICKSKFRIWRLIAYVSIWTISFLLFYQPQNLSINLINQNILTFYITATSGSFMVIETSKIINSKILSRYGLYSLAPMLIQFPCIWIIAKFILPNSPLQYIYVAIILLIITYLFIPILINRKYNIFKWRLKFYK